MARKLTVTIPTLGETPLPLTPHVKVKDDGRKSTSYVLTVGDMSTGQGFRGFYVPVPTTPDSLPDSVVLTVGSGKSAETVTVDLDRSDLPARTFDKGGKSIPLPPTARTVGSATVKVGDDPYRLTAETRVPPSGDDRVKVKVTLTPAPSPRGGVTADGNPFA